MSDGSGGFFNGVDLNSLSDEDWARLMAGINTPSLDMSSGTQGMGDRGLGTTDPTAGDSSGTLTPDEIAMLGANGGVGFGAPGVPQGSGALPPGSGGGGLGSILKSLGLTGGDGSLNVPLIASLLAAGAGGLMNKSATGKATDQILSSIKDANSQVTNILGPGGGASGALQPFISGGQTAMQNAGNMIYKSAGSAFTQPINGRVNLPPISLAAIMKRGK